jgi:hypothetical protein
VEFVVLCLLMGCESVDGGEMDTGADGKDPSLSLSC